MVIYAVKNGRPQYDFDKLVSGDPEYENLTAIGESEARRLGRSLNGLDIDYCISSGLESSLQTYDYAIDKKIPLYIDARLNERSFGNYGGKKLSGLSNLFDVKGLPKGDLLEPDFCEGGVESLVDFEERVLSLCKELKKSKDDILIFTHQNVISMLNYMYEVIDTEDIFGIEYERARLFLLDRNNGK